MESSDEEYESEYERRQRQVEREFAVRLKQEERAGARFEYAVSRLLIRALRVACGVVLLVGAWFCYEITSEIGAIPFAALTLQLLIKAISLAVLGFFLLIGGFKAAFGPGPTEAERQAKLRLEVESAIYQRSRGV